MKAEFKTGDIVHFRAYKERVSIQARVQKVAFGGFIGRCKHLKYHLSGIDKPLVSITGPRSIVESAFFVPLSEKDAFKD